MQTSKTRLMAISGATLALVVAGTVAVSADPGDRGNERGFGHGRIGAEFRQQFGKGMFDRGAMRERMLGRIDARIDQFVRRETIFESADGLVTRRIDHGTVSTAGDAGLEYTLANGETATVTTDGDTRIITFGEQSVEVGRRGFSRQRMVPEDITLADIEAGSEVLVWAESTDDGPFLAQRVVLRPMLDATTDATDSAAADSTAGGTTEDSGAAAVTDA